MNSKQKHNYSISTYATFSGRYNDWIYINFNTFFHLFNYFSWNLYRTFRNLNNGMSSTWRKHFTPYFTCHWKLKKNNLQRMLISNHCCQPSSEEWLQLTVLLAYPNICYLFQGSTQSPQHFSIPSRFFSASFMSWLIWSIPSSILSNCSVTHQTEHFSECD